MRCLSAGESRTNNAVFSAASANSRVAHRLDLRAGQHLLQRQADFLTDLARDQLVVAGQDLDRDTVLLKSADRRRGGFLGRIEEGDVAFQGQVVFVVLVVCGFGIEVAIGDGQDAETIGGQFVILLLEIFEQELIHRIDFLFQLEMRATVEDRLRRALANQTMFT